MADVPPPLKIVSYLDVVRSAYPSLPTTQPLDFPLDLAQAAHLVLHDPIYLSTPPRADLWITRADAPPTEQVLKEAIDPHQDAQVHVTREQVVFVHWMPADTGPWKPYLICRAGGGGFDVVSAAGRKRLPRSDYRWDRAVSWDEKLVVPCATGVSVLFFQPALKEAYHELAPQAPEAQQKILPEPQALLDWKGLLAWLPWEQGKSGGRGAARFVDGQWTDLGPSNGIPEKVLHLVPLNDGNVLVLARGDGNGIDLSLAVLDRVQVDEKKVAELVAALADPEEEKRQAAYKQLTTYGSGIWPILEKMVDDQEPEAKARLQLLLREKTEPTLGGMKLMGEKTLRLAARLEDGGTVFYAEAGVMMPPTVTDADPSIIAPAWISIRPGQPIELLPPALIGDLSPGRSKIYAVGSDWLVSTDVRGPRRFIGNGLVTMLRKKEQAYSDLIGQDRRGRWLFRAPPDFVTKQPATAPSTSAPAADPDATLIIDPTLPDPTPRLPVWVFRNAKEVGWDKIGWPVAKDVSSYALHESGWVLLPQDEPVYTRVEQMIAATTVPTTGPSTAPATGPTTIASTEPTTEPAAPLLTDGEGNRYYDGLTELRVVSRSGRETIWPLPAIAVGEGPAALVRTRDGHLFLFNQRGRVLRIKPTPDEQAPFRLEAVFTKDIPTIDHPTRIWLDPADRIIVAWGSQLAIMFPAGYIPPAIAEKMLGQPQAEE